MSVMADLRVNMVDLPVFPEVLGTPNRFVCPNRTVATKWRICVARRRFAYPCRFSDMMPCFNRSVSKLSLITSEVTDFILSTHGHLLTDFNQLRIHPERLQEYTDAIRHNKKDGGMSI